jgi:hypothetical protein
MNQYANYELECGHVQTVIHMDDLHALMTCATCQGKRRVKAVETREFRFKCLAHSLTRTCGKTVWCGQDEAKAFNAANAHNETTGHSTSDIGYVRVPGRQKQVQMLFGKRFPTIIIPKVRQTKHPLNPQPIQPVIPETADDNKKEFPF